MQFQLSNDFTMNPLLSCVWVGGKINGPASGSDGITLSKVDVDSSSAGKQFSFISTAGNFVSFKDFNQFRLFNLASKVVIATADITIGSSVQVVGSAPNVTTTLPAQTTQSVDTVQGTQGSSPTATKTNGALTCSSYSFLLALGFIAFL
ncbi:hypothetical protein HK103_002371 [Boothiomyces macroporosus]|uniref:Uncharacterized protein n=1 Tax=Boothiomyces macroporosus TaxID=261099 RepID=A0AAD5Y4T8_9FUNG|nr:hypothetical protein HK103_002371 [Boothiomyces macroporosus]